MVLFSTIYEAMKGKSFSLEYLSGIPSLSLFFPLPDGWWPCFYAADGIGHSIAWVTSSLKHFLGSLCLRWFWILSSILLPIKAVSVFGGNLFLSAWGLVFWGAFEQFCGLVFGYPEWFWILFPVFLRLIKGHSKNRFQYCPNGSSLLLLHLPF